MSGRTEAEVRDASGYCYGRTMGTKGLARRDVDLTALFYAVIAVSRTDGRTDGRTRTSVKWQIIRGKCVDSARVMLDPSPPSLESVRLGKNGLTRPREGRKVSLTLPPSLPPT